MNTRTTFAALTAAALMLAACGSADDASTEATADTVEMPADEALEAISDEAVADPDATATDAPDVDSEAGAETEAAAEDAADAAAAVAAEAAAAAEQASE
ncbi:hypothetical protein J3454_07830 [Erythrobacter sp. NFXS35]|uniref:hypothetical protein n=1 Tax=Erythrobacter sp. NFXS35 TaxID=2818436 RepID=UPI0032E00145